MLQTNIGYELVFVHNSLEVCLDLRAWSVECRPLRLGRGLGVAEGDRGRCKAIRYEIADLAYIHQREAKPPENLSALSCSRLAGQYDFTIA